MRGYQEMMQETFDQITQIGAGGGGTIFKAHHKRLDKDVVLKKIHVGLLGNIGKRDELNILKNLKHPYIPQIFDFIEYGDEVFTVMEYIPGKSFAQLLKEGKKFSQKESVKWMRQLCEVVDYLHAQKPPIVHCDIKPANLMLTLEGDICLIDFNISGVKSEEGVASIGYTQGYAPVEQFAVVTRRLESMQGQMGSGAQKDARPQGMPGKKPGSTEGKAWDARSESLAGASGKAGGEKQEWNRQTQASKPEDDQTVVLREDDQTVVLREDDRTVVLGEDSEATQLLRGEDTSDDRTEVSSEAPGSVQEARRSAKSGEATSKSMMRSMSDEEWTLAKRTEAAVGKKLMVDERTDIYSMGATLYHILTGCKPQPFYREQVPVQQINDRINESVAYVIEKAMALAPENRFRSSAQMLKTVRNMAVIDKRYKALSRRQVFAALVTGALAVASAMMISFGVSAMDREQTKQYQTYIEEMETARESGDYEAAAACYQSAVELKEEEQDAYFQMGMAYYEQRQYEQCIEFLSKNVYTNPVVLLDNSYGRFYYITGSCYFELEDYNQAVSYLGRAVDMQPDEIPYYRDYVVSLARNGEMEQAGKVLRQAEMKGVSADVISLLNGELAVLRGSLGQGEEYLRDCISTTEDEYVRLRAYTKLDDAYQLAGEEAELYDQRILLLTEALDILPSQYQVTLLERLAQVHIDYSDLSDRDYHCQSAIEQFERMEELGYATFTSRLNVAVLYEKMEKYTEAHAQLDGMLDTYPDNYVIYKRKAFVELDLQADKENSQRDYHSFETFYSQAKALYEEYAGGEDMEMLSLDQLYGDVKNNGWL